MGKNKGPPQTGQGKELMDGLVIEFKSVPAHRKWEAAGPQRLALFDCDICPMDMEYVRLASGDRLRDASPVHRHRWFIAGRHVTSRPSLDMHAPALHAQNFRLNVSLTQLWIVPEQI